MIDFTEYRHVCEQIGKLYSDLEVLEQRRADLERAMNGSGNGVAVAGSKIPRTVTTRQYPPDRQGMDKAAAFILDHVARTGQVSGEDIAKALECTKGAAEQRMYRLRDDARLANLQYMLGPMRFVPKRPIIGGQKG